MGLSTGVPLWLVLALLAAMALLAPAVRHGIAVAAKWAWAGRKGIQWQTVAVSVLLSACLSFAPQMQGCSLPSWPTPDEPDTPVVSPIPANGMTVLFVVEASDNSAEKLINMPEVLDYLNAKCEKVNGTPQHRMLDPNADMSKAGQVWKDAMARPRQSVPWVLIGGPNGGFEGPMPNTLPALVELLKKYGGA